MHAPMLGKIGKIRQTGQTGKLGKLRGLGKFSKTRKTLTEFKHPWQETLEMTITILAVAGIRTDNRPKEIHKPAH